MKTIDLIVTRGWHELDDKQLRYLFGLLTDDYSRNSHAMPTALEWAEFLCQ